MHQRAEILRSKKPLDNVQLLFRLLITVFILFIFLFSTPAIAQDAHCDEVPLTLRVEGIGSTELFSIICGKEVYVSVPELFNFLRIKNIPSDDFTSIKGYLLNQNDIFIIDVNQMELVYRGETIKLDEEDLKRTPTNLYLKSNFFGDVFQLEISSSIRTMSIEIKPSFELPSLRLARREKLRENLKQLQTGVTAADTSLSKESSLFQLGVADWDVNLNQRSEGESHDRFNLGLGGLLAGGVFSSNFHYNSYQGFSPNNQFYRWQYINNDNAALRQITLGKIGIRSISTLLRPVVGFQLTNAPTYLKRSFGTYELSDYTEPDWIVELYINGVLIDFKQADAAGFFSFDVPLMYGSTDINLRYYGPYGEEQIVERQFTIPFVFMPKNEFEYGLNAGLVEDGENTVFAQARMNYGLSKSISLGGGVEYLSSLEQHSVMPFLNTAIRLPGNMLFSAEYAHNVGVKGDFSYTSPSNLRLELKYAKYQEEQTAVRFTFLEERQLLLSTPFSFGKFHGSSRIRLRQNILRNSSYYNPELFLSTRIYGVNLNFTTNALFRKNDDPLIYSRLSSSIMLPKQIIFTPQLDYEYNSHSLNALQGQLRKRIFKSGYLRTSYGYNFAFDQFSFNIGLNLNVGFSRFSLSSNTSSRENSFTESAGGNILIGSSLSQTRFSDRTSMDRAHVKFIAYLDINGNELQDDDEPMLQGMEVSSISGGQREKANDGSTLFRGMEPYVEHHFTINTDHLNRIAWRVKNKRLNIYLNPNQMRLVEIPVSVVGEVGGYVLNSAGKGLGGIKIQVLNSEQQKVEQIISEPDGFFSYLGLKSGDYTAQLDPAQLENLKLESNGPFKFKIHNTSEGDYIDDLEFIVSDGLKEKDSTSEGIDGFEGEQLQEKKPGAVTEEKEAAAVNTEGENPEEKEDVSTIEKEKTTALVIEGVGKADERRVGVEELNWDVEEITASDREKALITKGLYYKVQILTSEKFLQMDDPRFNGFKNISYEETDSGYRYTYGKTLLPFEATKLQQEMRRSGFNDAFVVHYFKGDRISVDEALSIRKLKAEVLFKKNGQEETLKDVLPTKKTDKQGFFKKERRKGKIYLKDRNFSGIGGISLEVRDSAGRKVSTILSEADGSFITPYLQPGKYTIEVNEEKLTGIGMKLETSKILFQIPQDNISQEPQLEFFLVGSNSEASFKATDEKDAGLVFKVQVLASVPKLPVSHPLLKGLEDVERYRHKGLYKYSVGESYNLKEIRRIRKNVLESGFEDAFIVAFLNGVRINLQEMTGQILEQAGKKQQGIEGIGVEIKNAEGEPVTSLVSDRDGRISFLGLKPEYYTAQLDIRQLEEVGLESDESKQRFEIQRNTEGEINDPIMFRLKRIKGDNLDAEKETANLEYRVQLAASNVPLGPNHPTLKRFKKVSMYEHGGMFKYTVGSTYSLREAKELLEKIGVLHNRFSLFIVGFKEGKRVLIME